MVPDNFEYWKGITHHCINTLNNQMRLLVEGKVHVTEGNEEELSTVLQSLQRLTSNCEIIKRKLDEAIKEQNLMKYSCDGDQIIFTLPSGDQFKLTREK